MQKTYLILENGKKYEGISFGVLGESVGELVFSTGVVGYSEGLADPRSFGQLVIFTFPQFGNYGIINADMESPTAHVRGAIVREFCDTPSNFRCEETVDEYFKKNNIVGIAGVDTRELTQLLRDGGTMNAVITPNADFDWSSLKDYRIVDAVKAAGASEKSVIEPEGDALKTVALINYGATKSLIENFTKRGCRVISYPWNASAEEILKDKPDGVILSNGPGSPDENAGCIEEVKKLLGKLPIFGVGLGHQLLALAAGAKTVKLKFGHHGGQPVKDIKLGKVYITTQNHNYAVDNDSLAGTCAQLRFVNVNDGSCEGLEYPDKIAFSTQFIPSAHGGPHDFSEAYEKFISMMEVR